MVTDSRGYSRISLPKSFIDALGWENGEPVVFDVKKDSIVITPVASFRQDRQATGAETTTVKGDCR